MRDLVEWLETAISEDERLARNVADTADSWWVTRRSVSQDLDPVVTALHDSARTELARRFTADAVLRRFQADRKILALCDELDRDAIREAERAGTFAPGTIRSSRARDIRRTLAEGYGYQEADHG